jgi:hypothetical protein
VRPQEDEIVRFPAEDALRSGPQQRSLRVRAVVGALGPALPSYGTKMPDHCVVPGDELFCQFPGFIRADLIAETPVCIHRSKLLTVSTPTRCRRIDRLKEDLERDVRTGRLRQQRQSTWNDGPHVPWGMRATEGVVQIHGSATFRRCLSQLSGPPSFTRGAQKSADATATDLSQRNHEFKLKLTVTVTTNRSGFPFRSNGE